MHLNKSQNRINELMSIFVAQIRHDTGRGRTDLNKEAETILIPLFSEIYGYTNLKNLNADRENYPGIDLEGELLLGDESIKTAFQITATANTDKVKKTLKKFVKWGLYENYDRLVVYILTEKQKSYSGKGYDEILKGKFNFDKDNDIWDSGDLLKKVSNFQIDKCLKIQDILEKNFGNLQAVLIDWHSVCGKVLDRQQEQQRIRRKITERGFELNIFVPLGLVERREQQKSNNKVSQDKNYQLQKEVITKKYQHEAFLEEAINCNSSSQKNLAIIGEPGTGKSTLLDKIASWIQENDRGLPICVALGSLQGKTIADYLLENWLSEALNHLDVEQRKNIDAVKDSLKELFRTQPVYLLLDGLDEMAISHNAVASIREQLQGWVGKARIILTSRLNVWDARVNNPLSNFDTYKTLDFTNEQVEEFIDDWFIEAEKADISPTSIISELSQLGTQLKAKVKESRYQNLQQLIKNPLRLSLLCQTWYHQQGDLPETKAGLYKRFVREFYQEWKPEQHSLIWTKQKQLNQTLGKLALGGIYSEARFRLPESLAFEVMGEELFLLACDIGWLNLVDRDSATGEPIYAFYHPTFQEYFAATVIDNWNDFVPREHKNKPIINQQYRIFQSEWKEIILFWLGRQDVNNNYKELFINKLLLFKDGCGKWTTQTANRGFYEYQAYFLAVEGLAEFEHSQTRKIIERTIDYAIGYCLLSEEAWSALLLSNIHSVIAILTERLQNNFYSGQYELCLAAELLGQIDLDNRVAIDILSDLILNPSDYDIDTKAIKSFEEIATENFHTIEQIIKIIQKSKKENISNWAAKMLCRLPEKKRLVTTVLIEIFGDSFNEYNIDLNELAQEIINNVKKKDYCWSSKLINFIKNPGNKKNTWMLYHSYLFRGLSNYYTDSKPEVDTLIKIIESNTDPRDSKYWQAILDIGEKGKGNSRAIALLSQLCQSSNDEFIVMRAAKSLYEIDPRNPLIAATFIKIAKQSSHCDKVKDAITFLGQIYKANRNKDEIIETLTYIIQQKYNSKILKDYEKSVVWRVAETLGIIDQGNPIAINKLVEFIENSQSEYDSLLPAEVLAEIDPQNYILYDTFVELIQNSDDEHLRGRALDMLMTTALVPTTTKKIVRDFRRYIFPREYENNLKQWQDIESKGIFYRLNRSSLLDKCRSDSWHFQQYYDLLWQVSQNLSYSEFYEAWQYKKFSFCTKWIWLEILFKLKGVAKM